MLNKNIFFILPVIGLFIYAEQAYSFEPSDLDGTWIDDIEALTSPSIREWQYIWGMGKTILNSTLVFEMEKDLIRMAGGGGYVIGTIEKEGISTIKMKIYGIFDEKKEWGRIIKFHFESYDKLWIECPEIERWMSVGEDNPWYRLSGPNRRNGIINDNRVRIRSGSNLNSSILGHVGQGDKVKIIEQTESRQKIDDMEAPWLKIITMEGIEGWVYGAYVDIVP